MNINPDLTIPFQPSGMNNNAVTFVEQQQQHPNDNNLPRTTDNHHTMRSSYEGNNNMHDSNNNNSNNTRVGQMSHSTSFPDSIGQMGVGRGDNRYDGNTFVPQDNTTVNNQGNVFIPNYNVQDASRQHYIKQHPSSQRFPSGDSLNANNNNNNNNNKMPLMQQQQPLQQQQQPLQHQLHHESQHQHQQQQQQQVFYVAVPTQDGRGQVLQPIQMLQLPGQVPTFVLPTLPNETNNNHMHLNSGVTNMGQSQMKQGQGAQITAYPSMSSINGNDNNNNINMVVDQSRNTPDKGLRTSQQSPAQQIKRQNMNMVGNNNININTSGAETMYMDRFNSEVSYDSKGAVVMNGNGYNNNNAGGTFVSHNGEMVYNMGPDFGATLNRTILPTITTKASHNTPATTNNSSTDFITSLYTSPQRPPLRDLLGHVRRLSRDQVGCRLLQQSLDEEGSPAATMILKEGLTFWGEAMVDPFGNYLFQKILEKITAEERILLVQNVSHRLVNASLNLHGTRSVQKIVELCASDEAEIIRSNKNGKNNTNNSKPPSPTSSAGALTKALAPAAARLCIDSHGNHVIQRILLKLPYNHSKFVFDAVAASVGDVARHRHGCCVIQRCLDSPHSAARSHLVRRIVEKSLELMQDAYGNYVVQYVLDVCGDDDVHAVCESVVGRVCLLSIQKFSSNVMEKCLERCTDRVREHYLNELSDTDRVRELMLDPFGNYVIQRALAVATHAQAVRLVDALRPHLNSPQGSNQNVGGIRNTAGGRRIMAKISRRFPNFNLGGGGLGEDQQQTKQIMQQTSRQQQNTVAMQQMSIPNHPYSKRQPEHVNQGDVVFQNHGLMESPAVQNYYVMGCGPSNFHQYPDVDEKQV